MTLTNKQVGKYMLPQGRAQVGHSALGTVRLEAMQAQLYYMQLVIHLC